MVSPPGVRDAGGRGPCDRRSQVDATGDSGDIAAGDRGGCREGISGTGPVGSTTVQYADPAADESHWQGVAPSLIAALVDRTDQRTAPVAIEAVAPSRAFWMLSLAAALLVAIGGVIYSTNWEWRVAAHRTLLQNSAYSVLDVPDGAMTVDEGGTAHIAATVTGRMNQPLRIWTRRQDKPDAEWAEQVLEQGASQNQQGDPRPRHEYATR